MSEFSITIERIDTETRDVFSRDVMTDHGWESPAQYLTEMRRRRNDGRSTYFENGYTQTSHCGTYETQYTVAPPIRHNPAH